MFPTHCIGCCLHIVIFGKMLSWLKKKKTKKQKNKKKKQGGFYFPPTVPFSMLLLGGNSSLRFKMIILKVPDVLSRSELN